MTSAIAYAHAHNRVIHCDVKPDNFILFPDNVLKLADFGIAKVAYQTLRASGSGTVGYVAPEQAMGKPSFRSDVFSLGLILYRMFSGVLPEWPYAGRLPSFGASLQGSIQTSSKCCVERSKSILDAAIRMVSKCCGYWSGLRLAPYGTRAGRRRCSRYL
jgi:serine/threonine protein kinase